MDYFSLFEKFPKLFDNNKSPLKLITNSDKILSWQKKRRRFLRNEGKLSSWADIGVVLNDPYILVIRDLVEIPNHTLNGYLRIIYQAELTGSKDGGSVGILPIIDENVLLLNHFRHATRKWHFEIPRGFGEPNFSSKESAHREIFEETRGEIRELIDLGPYHANTGLEGSEINLYLAYLDSIGLPNKNEGIAGFHIITVSELEKMIREGEISDGFTIAAYTRAKLKGLL